MFAPQLSMAKKVNTGVKVSKIEGHSFFTKNLNVRSVLVVLVIDEGNVSRNLISTFDLKSYGIAAEEHIY
jgi:hypothetical protein